MKANRMLSIIVSAGLIYQGIGFGGLSKNSSFVSFGVSGEDMRTTSSYRSMKKNDISMTNIGGYEKIELPQGVDPSTTSTLESSSSSQIPLQSMGF